MPTAGLLVAGGHNSNGYLQSLEVFNLAAGRSCTVEKVAMSQGRHSHTLGRTPNKIHKTCKSLPPNVINRPL